MAVVEVVDGKYDKTVGFDVLEVGETFRFGDNLYLKVNHNTAFSFNERRNIIFNKPTSAVVPVNSKLVVEGREWISSGRIRRLYTISRSRIWTLVKLSNL